MFRSSKLPERFWTKVALVNGCWEWTASKVSGYGRFGFGRKVRVYAHRYCYEMLVGVVPDGLELDHRCRNRACVNPDHLEPVTRRTNILRGLAPAAENVLKTHCAHGHELVGDNIYQNGNRRVCKECRKRIDRARNGTEKRILELRINARNNYRRKHNIPLDQAVRK